MLSTIKKIIYGNYQHCVDTITDISLDTSNNKKISSLTNNALSYDKIIKNKYVRCESPKSPDIIVFSPKHITFIEFKNSHIDADLIDQVALKGIEGGFIALYDIAKHFNDSITFNDIVSIEKKYILVYSTEKNGAENEWSNNFKHFTRLERYKGTFFSKVASMSAREFDNMFKDKKLY